MSADPAGRKEEAGPDAANSAPTPPAEPASEPAEGAQPAAPHSQHTESQSTRPEPAKSDAPAAGGVPKPAPWYSLLLTRRAALVIILCAALASALLYLRQRAYILNRLKAGAERAKEVLTGQPSTPRDLYAEAVSEVEADRGEAEGRAAQIEVPAELKQYKEPRRFLAVQSASAAEAGVRPPHDFAELAEMIKGGRDFVEAPRLGRGYVLYGVGLTATGELTHYDAARRKNVPLFADADELKSFLEGLAADRTRLEAELKEAQESLKGLGRQERAERARLLAAVAARKKELDGLEEKEELLASYYGKAGGKEKAAGVEKARGTEKGADKGGDKKRDRDRAAGVGKAAAGAKRSGREKAGGKKVDAKKSGGETAGGGKAGGGKAGGEKPGGVVKGGGGERLFAEYASLAGLARDFGGRTYDLRDRASAKEFQARLLSYLRPAALSVMEELGSAYQAKFDRPLPVTSLVRTEEYQRLLRESGNPNAADVAPPPHTTGLAFDVYYRFMTAAEQEFVMGEIARLEREGRVEALRELRDHYHVFVFPEGRPPEEKQVEKVLRGRRR